jgi:hypothetical protein
MDSTASQYRRLGVEAHEAALDVEDITQCLGFWARRVEREYDPRIARLLDLGRQFEIELLSVAATYARDSRRKPRQTEITERLIELATLGCDVRSQSPAGTH